MVDVLEVQDIQLVEEDQEDLQAVEEEVVQDDQVVAAQVVQVDQHQLEDQQEDQLVVHQAQEKAVVPNQQVTLVQ